VKNNQLAWVQIPGHASIPKKINKAPSVRVIVICSDHRPLWRDSDKGTDHASILSESALHYIIIIVNGYAQAKSQCINMESRSTTICIAWESSVDR